MIPTINNYNKTSYLHTAAIHDVRSSGMRSRRARGVKQKRRWLTRICASVSLVLIKTLFIYTARAHTSTICIYVAWPGGQTKFSIAAIDPSSLSLPRYGGPAIVVAELSPLYILSTIVDRRQSRPWWSWWPTGRVRANDGQRYGVTSLRTSLERSYSSFDVTFCRCNVLFSKFYIFTLFIPSRVEEISRDEISSINHH